MSTYGQYCPIVRATEIVAERWTSLILRELLTDVHRFSELERGLPGIPRSLLSQRLVRLGREGIVERRVEPGGRTAGYWLTPKGRSLKVGRGRARNLGRDLGIRCRDPAGRA